MNIKFYKNELNNEILETVCGVDETIMTQNINPLTPNTVDAALEKHVPVVSFKDDKVFVNVGELAHPMEESHYIEWIEIVGDDFVMRKYLIPGGQPEAVFQVSAKNVKAYIYCNLHGLWESK